MNKLKFIAFIFVAFLSFDSFSKEREMICAKYRTTNSWSKGYEVEGIVTKGYELNQATNTYDYEGYSTYVVIFWDQEEASVIEMESSFITLIEQNGYDQSGRAWKIKKGGICY